VQDLYCNQQKSALEISKIFGVAVQTIINRLRSNNIEIRNSGFCHQKIDLATIRDEYNRGMSTPEIAKKHGLNAVSVWERLKKNGVQCPVFAGYFGQEAWVESLSE